METLVSHIKPSWKEFLKSGVFNGNVGVSHKTVMEGKIDFHRP